MEIILTVSLLKFFFCDSKKNVVRELAICILHASQRAFAYESEFVMERKGSLIKTVDASGTFFGSVVR